MLSGIVAVALFIGAPFMGLLLGGMLGVGVLMVLGVEGEATRTMRAFQVGGIVFGLWFAYYASQTMAENSRRGVSGSGLQVEDTYRRR